MNLLFCFTESWLPQAKTTLISIAKNTPDQPQFDLYVFHDDISEENMRAFQAFAAEQCRTVVHPIAVGPEWFADWRVTVDWPRVSYFRLLAPLLLPESVDRILYMDVDILALNSLHALYEMPLDGAVCAAFSELHTTASATARLGLPQNHEYVCAGVIVMDLKEWRQVLHYRELMYDTYTAHWEHLVFNDQDLLNLMFWEQIKRLDYGYDCVAITDAAWHSKAFVAHLEQKNAILHFVTQHKPWSSQYANRHTAALYRKYAQMAGWRPAAGTDLRYICRRLPKIAARFLIGRYVGKPAHSDWELAWRKSKQR